MILCILTLWPTDPQMSPNRYTTQSWTCEVARLNLASLQMISTNIIVKCITCTTLRRSNECRNWHTVGWNFSVSIACISNGKMEGCSMLAKGRGSRSCVLVALIICCECNVNCYSMREFLDFRMFVSHGSHLFIICLESAFWDGDITGRESPGWGNSWFRTWVL